MEFLKKLHQLERAKRYEEYCDLAEIILKKEKDNISPTNSLHIKKRRDFYITKLIHTDNITFNTENILDSLSAENYEILIKCCPGIEYKKIRKKSKEEEKKLISEQTLLSVSITKNKYLRADFDSTKESHKTSRYYFYQALLTSDLRLKRLNSQSAGELQGLETEVISLDNEFMPVFIISANLKYNKITNLQLIYFPSMIPGGYHYSELVDEYHELNLIESLDRYTKKIRDTRDGCKLDYLLMKPGHHDLGIGYANEDFRKWITNVHGIKILKEYEPSSQCAILALPQKAYPTISVIVNGILDNIYSDDNVNSVDILIVNEFDYDPLYKLQASFPKLQTRNLNNIDNLYPFLIGANAKKYPQNKDIRGPICIYPGENNVPYSAHPILPFDILNGKDEQSASKALFIIVNVDVPENITEEFILSIYQQRQVQMKKVIFIAKSKHKKRLKKILVKILNDWQVIMDFDIIINLNQITTIIGNGSHTLVINENIVLQNLNIISILQSNLVKYNAFTSGCILSYLSSSKKRELYENVSCGMYPTFNSFSQSGRLTLEAKNITSLLHSSEVNVLSNHYDFCLYQSDSILAGIARNELLSDLNQFLVQLSCKAVLAGKNNICSTRLSVQYINYPTLNTTITLDSSLTENIMNNFYKIRKHLTNIKELMP